ncbi:CDGSH iron-sulfur domain-containing protein [Clavibacter michiganensis]|uniref:CDGSH iron-sulfur domain-containing protein n=1 Tax=Clavibacter michiganensis TaxID=28447 RepID=UPI000A38EFFB|nr:CDGSH iron-sulfur domain-containing protein [Clavibacter michiganensis]
MRPAGDVPRIIAYPDGPLLVRGEFEIVDPDGCPVPRTRSTVALCRCGVSSIKPYCDGTHRLVGFRTDPPAPTAD